jgi:hypothetical protein
MHGCGGASAQFRVFAIRDLITAPFKRVNGKRWHANLICVNGRRHKPLGALFEQVRVVSLKRQTDRLERFRKEIENVIWPFLEPDVFFAIDGDKVGVPKFWQTGGGSYGCLRSHLILLERAGLDGL